MNRPFETKINGQDVLADSQLDGFELMQRKSSHVAFFGIRRATNQLFVQYTNGKCYIYSGVPLALLEEAKESASIGKFLHAQINSQYAGVEAQSLVEVEQE